METHYAIGKRLSFWIEIIFELLISRDVIRSYLKKVFSPGIGVESLSQVLDILEYACGLILGLALISNENPNFEIASKQQFATAAVYNKLRMKSDGIISQEFK